MATTISASLSCSKLAAAKIHSAQRKRPQTTPRRTPKKTFLPFPPSRPTPITTAPKPRPTTHLEALDNVVADLESAAAKSIAVDTDILASLLETCHRLHSLHHATRIHRLIPAHALRRNYGLSSKLLRLYAACGRVETAHEVFDQMARRDDSAFAWNSLISGYAERGMNEDALALYFQMEEENVRPDNFTFPRVLKACSGIGSVQLGEEVFRRVVRSGFWDDGFVLNALVDMYSKCGDIVKARKVFEKIPDRDSVSWNSLLTGYFRHGLLTEALEVLRRMIREGFEPDSVAVSTVLSNGTSLCLGVEIHGWSVRQGIELSLSIGNSLIVMYSNHGELELARRVFDQMPDKDVVSWNSVISAHSKTPRALLYFNEMERNACVFPDRITFVSLLSTCAHLGLVSEGEELFSIMCKKYGIKPIMEHYGCMVNLYGRAGNIKEAYNVITKAMSFEAGPTIWGALLYACSVHGDVTIGEIAAERLMELEPDNEHNFELLMKIYGNAQRLEDVERVRMMMVERGLV